MEDHAGICGLGDAPTSDLLPHPDEVMSESELSEFGKQAILTDWASDTRADEDAPELRQLDNGAFVHIGDVLKAPKLCREHVCGDATASCSAKESTYRQPDL